MIVGSGLLAKAFARHFDADSCIWIHAAGVSNSSCTDTQEFERDRLRLLDSLQTGLHADVFVYFSTCSIGDPTAVNSAYVRHKVAMEGLVSAHPSFIITRLPQLAGQTPNPHTLLNYLYARVSRSESFGVWKNATRNIIDVEDVVAILTQLIKDTEARQLTINIANPVSYPITNIVAAMEKATGKTAIIELIDDGAAYEIDISQIRPIINKLGLLFDPTYLPCVIEKYFGESRK